MLIKEERILETISIFNSFTNLSGCESDHKFSRMDGFINDIFSEILRNSTNCQLLTHFDNSSKREKSCITKEELFREIRCYDKHWQEQEIILNLIDRYESEEEFIVDNYRRCYYAVSLVNLRFPFRTQRSMSLHAKRRCYQAQTLGHRRGNG